MQNWHLYTKCIIFYNLVCVHVCTCMGVSVFLCVWVYMYVQICVEARSAHWVLTSWGALLNVLRQSLSGAWGSLTRLRSMASELQRPACLLPQCWDYKYKPSCPAELRLLRLHGKYFTDSPPSEPAFYWTKYHGDNREFGLVLQQTGSETTLLFRRLTTIFLSVSVYGCDSYSGRLTDELWNEWARPSWFWGMADSTSEPGLCFTAGHHRGFRVLTLTVSLPKVTRQVAHSTLSDGRHVLSKRIHAAL